MERYNAFAVICIFLLYMVASAVAIGEGCGVLITDELKNNVVENLYGIEVGLKSQHQVPYILHNFLNNNFQEAEEGLGSLIHHLSLFSVTNFTRSANNSSEAVNFSKHVIIEAKKARSLIHQLNHCKNSTTTHEQPLKRSLSSIERSKSDCVVDGSKCQYSQCAQGKKLPICAYGFARGVTGGAFGPYYIVSSSYDDPKNPAPGTLRFAVNFARGNKGGAWIRFKRSMIIRLKDKLWIHSNTTIDGRGVEVAIIGQCIAIRHVENVILHNFAISLTGNSDTIHVFEGTKKVWIDHITTREAKLGLISVLQGSTDVTISNCYLSKCDFNLLLGASDQDTVDHILRVTVHRNRFESSTQRMPHCRWGYCHVANNYYRNWNYYAIGARVYAKVYSELNVFNPGKKLEVTPWFHDYNSDITPTIVSFKDLLLKGAKFHQFLHHGTLRNPRDLFHDYVVPVRPTDKLEELVINCSGVLFGSKLKHCLETP
ncbi:putative pectate lyase 21 [Macadamia integrifolia]|uniref:putative pectate lyase 21 n=1 Tax=Macadamia integrifolia TaxID=60698 RepID=UPI001C527B9C|nr:putative pectate lyase 21 [Macadamia integrifolia]